MSSSSWIAGLREEEERARRAEGGGTFRGMGLMAIRLVRDANDDEAHFVGAVRLKLVPEDPGSDWRDWDLRGDW